MAKNNAHNVIDLDAPTGQTDDDDGRDDASTLGEPFALATGAELLEAEGRIPGCIVSARCDCGSAFKFSLLSPGFKACPGCGTQYTHALLLAPADDTEIIDQFLEVLESEEDDEGTLDGADDDDQTDDDATIDGEEEAPPRTATPTRDPYNTSE
jgi:hypothetical protein